MILEKGDTLIGEFSFNDLIKREIAEIGMFLENAERREKYIINKHCEIEHDIVRIYRITEILNSVIYTYYEYIKILKNKDASPKEICKPKYLFIG